MYSKLIYWITAQKFTLEVKRMRQTPEFSFLLKTVKIINLGHVGKQSLGPIHTKEHLEVCFEHILDQTTKFYKNP